MFGEYVDVLTAEEARQALRIGNNALYKLLESGKLKAFKNGKVWLVPKAALEEYILKASKLK